MFYSCSFSPLPPKHTKKFKRPTNTTKLKIILLSRSLSSSALKDYIKDMASEKEHRHF